MPTIEITTIDQTTPGPGNESFEVVYIPGCVDVSQSCLYSKGVYTGLNINEPTLFTNVSDFELRCGTRGLEFEEDQDYRSLIFEGSKGFSTDAVPVEKVIFKKDTIDPAYVMAKELLSAGLNVLYERINKDAYYKEVTTEPQDWTTNYSSYLGNFYQSSQVSDATAPTLGNIATKETDEDEKVKYTITDPAVEMILTKDTSPNKDTTYYVLEEETVNKERYYIEVAVDKKFDPNTSYFTKGREFYTLKPNDYTADKSVLNDMLVKRGEITVLGTEEVYRLIKIPKDEIWAATYWTSYYFKQLVEKVNIPQFEKVEPAPTEKDPTATKLVFAHPTYTEVKDVSNIYKESPGINLVEVYKALEGVYDSESENGLADRGNYNIKYITSGGYPVYEYNGNSIVNKMVKLAAERKDCVAIIDHTDNAERAKTNINLPGSLYAELKNDTTFHTDGDYATMFTPWATYVRTTVDKDGETALSSKDFRMPASYAYLTCLADSIQTNASWLAVAGAARGVVGHLAKGGMTDIPNGAADKMQPRNDVALNAITNIRPYGYTIWGNRTLKKNAVDLTATSFLNIRNLVSDISKTCYKAARSLTFEQNNEILWVNFRSKIAPTLDRMVSGYGISGYKIIRDTKHPKASQKATICAKIILYPVYAVEDFYITIVLKDDEISVESAE